MRSLIVFCAVLAVTCSASLWAVRAETAYEEAKASEAEVNGAVQDGRYQEALSLLERRIAANEEREYSLYLKGVVLYLKEDYDGCVRTLDELMKE
ncbi:MAG: hypothetical protein Q8Q12_10790, partial [bacterium]|nr:hypothetical protein [bacterium]